MRTKFASPATEVLYKSIVGTVLKNVERSKFQIDDMKELFRRLKAESETAQVLIFSAYFEDKIQDLLKSHLVDVEEKKKEERLFGANGPLGTFSSRILMMRHLGWLAPWSADCLDAWRKIRNEFAHAAYKTSFGDQKITDLWNNVSTHSDSVFIGLYNDLPNSKLRDLEKLPEDRRRLIKLSMFTVETFHQLLVLPVAKSWSVAPVDVMTVDWDQMPAPVKHLWQIGAEAIVCIAEDN